MSFKSIKVCRKCFLLTIIAMLILSSCSTDNGKSRAMPEPDANVKPPVTAGATITPSEKTDSSALSSSGTDTVSPDKNNNGDAVGTDNSTGPDATGEGGAEANVPETKHGYTVVLDPGHGGGYTGAIYFGKMEKDLTLQMANYVKEYLLSNYDDIEVYFTRDSDIALAGDLKIELENRAIVAQEHNADFFISLHFNASEEHTLNGATVYASFREHVAEKSQAMAASILEQLVALGLKDNNVKTRKSADYKADDGSALDYYAVIRHSAARDIPGLIVEHCFMDNDIDHAFMDTDDKLRELAKADAVGIANYLELPQKKTQ